MRCVVTWCMVTTFSILAIFADNQTNQTDLVCYMQRWFDKIGNEFERYIKLACSRIVLHKKTSYKLRKSAMENGKVTKSVENNYTRVEIICRDGWKTSYKYKTQEEYTTDYLSVENLRYYKALNDIDEEDDYLLNHALQENKRVSCSFWTRNELLIRDTFSDRNRYSVVSKDAWKKGFKTVFVARKGCLNDYFNIEEISDWYDARGINYNYGVFEIMCNTEMITVMSGGFSHPSKSMIYSPIMDIGGDDILWSFGAAGLMVSGLLFGYPLESTVDLIRSRGIDY